MTVNKSNQQMISLDFEILFNYLNCYSEQLFKFEGHGYANLRTGDEGDTNGQLSLHSTRKILRGDDTFVLQV